MANEKLSQLPSGVSTLTVADLLYLVQSGASVSITIGDIPAAFALASAATPAAGTFTTLNTNGAHITGGNIDATLIGGNTPFEGVFTEIGITNGPLTFLNVSSVATITGGSRFCAIGGKASVINDGESTALPITRTVGNGVNSSGGSLSAGSNVDVVVTVTGTLTTDRASAELAATVGFTGTGGLVIVKRVCNSGSVTVTVGNTDPGNTYSIPTISVVVER